MTTNLETQAKESKQLHELDEFNERMLDYYRLCLGGFNSKVRDRSLLKAINGLYNSGRIRLVQY